MLLTRIRSGRAALGCAAILALLWPGLAVAQAQVEAVPEPPPPFDMWDLDALEGPTVMIPGEPVAPLPPDTLPGQQVMPSGSIDVSQQPGDPCRHFTEEERRRLFPNICGASD